MRPGPANDRQSGWSPDPAGRFDQRYRVGGRWTRRVRVEGVEAIDTLGVDDEPPETTPGWQRVEGAEWRDDPAGRFDQRWWDGRAWSRKVRVGGHVATDAKAAPLVRRSRGDTGDGPGWRDDPDGDGQRYWNGHSWTAKQRAGPPPRSSNLSGWWSRTLVTSLVVLGVVLVLAVVALAVVLR